LTQRRIAAEHGRFSRIRQVAPMCPSSNTCFVRPTQIHNPNDISIGSTVFAQLTVEGPYTLHWATPFPQNCPFVREIGTPSNT